MTVLLARDEVVLFAPGELDDHGWRLPSDYGYWQGTGNLQLAAGPSEPRAAGGGGHGPHGPARDLAGVVFLPADALPAEGSTADIRGTRYVLSQVRMVLDPVTDDGLSCWVATATSIDTWPDGGTPRDE